MTIPRFGTDEQVELTNDTAPLNDIAFKMLDKKVAQPIVRRIGQQHSYTNYRYIIIGDVREDKIRIKVFFYQESFSSENYNIALYIR